MNNKRPEPADDAPRKRVRDLERACDLTLGMCQQTNGIFRCADALYGALVDAQALVDDGNEYALLRCRLDDLVNETVELSTLAANRAFRRVNELARARHDLARLAEPAHRVDDTPPADAPFGGGGGSVFVARMAAARGPGGPPLVDPAWSGASHDAQPIAPDVPVRPSPSRKPK